MKNVAVINTCDFGSTGKIAQGLFQHLKRKDYRCFFLYGRGEKRDKDGVIRIEGKLSIVNHYAITRILGNDGYGSYFATRKMIHRLKKDKIDTIFIVSIYGHYLNEKLFFEYLRKEKTKVVYIMIDEYAYLGGCTYSGDCRGYQERCLCCPRHKSNLIAKATRAANRKYTSRYKVYRALEQPVFVGPEYTLLSAKNTGLLNGLETKKLDEAIDTDLYSPKDTDQFRTSLNIPKEKIIIVCVAPYSYRRKGVKYFYELAKQMTDYDRYIFIHVGYDGKEKSFPPNMIVKGYEKDQNVLSYYYSLADLFVFPSLQDTMPNACLEALSCGTPLLCFNISGMPYIANNEVASFVEAGNVEQMKEVILHTNKKSNECINNCRTYALQRYSSKDYFDRLERIGTGEFIEPGRSIY